MLFRSPNLAISTYLRFTSKISSFYHWRVSGLLGLLLLSLLIYVIFAFVASGSYKEVSKFAKNNFSVLMSILGISAVLLLAIIAFRVMNQSSQSSLIEYERCLDQYDRLNARFVEAFNNGEVEIAVLYQNMANERKRECERILNG